MPNEKQDQPRLEDCPFCGDAKGVYIGDSPKANPSLRYQAECVCGASGAPRATPAAAAVWWNTRKDDKT